MKPSLSHALLAFVIAALVGSAAAAAAAAAADAPPTNVLSFDHTRLDHAFTTGTGGYLQVNSRYKVIAARRVVAPTGAGVEIHTFDTDVFYIVDGTATFVTGGTAVNPKATGPGEMKATGITGGTEHHLAKGDVIIVPKGTPHLFTKIDGPFLYFVVKVTE